MANPVLCMIIIIIIISTMVPHVRSDFAQDKKVCQSQLVSLSPCVGFVSGDAKAPPPTCCAELRKDASKSQLCLCVLIKDRNEPDLSFKLNVTLALSLISICRLQSNTTICPELLHMDPSSPEAQVFEQFGNYSGIGSDSSSSGGIVKNSSSSKLIGKGLKDTIIHGLFLIWVLRSVFGGSI